MTDSHTAELFCWRYSNNDRKQPCIIHESGFAMCCKVQCCLPSRSDSKVGWSRANTILPVARFCIVGFKHISDFTQVPFLANY